MIMWKGSELKAQLAEGFCRNFNRKKHCCQNHGLYIAISDEMIESGELLLSIIWETTVLFSESWYLELPPKDYPSLILTRLCGWFVDFFLSSCGIKMHGCCMLLITETCNCLSTRLVDLTMFNIGIFLILWLVSRWPWYSSLVSKLHSGCCHRVTAELETWQIMLHVSLRIILLSSLSAMVDGWVLIGCFHVSRRY